MSLHDDVFRPSANLSDANRPGARKVDHPSPQMSYLLLGAANEKYPDGVMFGAVRLGRRYVSYYLMCVSMRPELLAPMSPQLRRRMQGESCFNFTRVDDGLFDELSALTDKGREMYADSGWLAQPPT